MSELKKPFIGKLYIEDDFVQDDGNWSGGIIKIDMKKDISYQIKHQLDDININDEEYTKIENLLKNIQQNGFWDKFYDWADINNIKIETLNYE